MIIQKVLETTIDITDANDIFNPDLNSLCIKYLELKYLNKCYMSCLIIKINKIIRNSSRFMSNELHGYAKINVEFEVNGIIYTKGEVIPNCRIIKIENNGYMHCSSEYAGIQIRPDSKVVNIYKEGQIVPFIVKRVMYNPSQSSISVEASLFIPMIQESLHYYCQISTSSNGIHKDMPRLKYLFDKIKELDEQIPKFNTDEKKAYGFFQSLLYPYKKETAYDNTLFKRITLSYDKITDFGSHIVLYKPDSIHSHSLDVYTADPDHGLKNIPEFPSETYPQYLKESIESVLDKYLIKILYSKQLLLDLVKTYPTFEKVQEYADIWRMYTMLKT